MSPPEGAPLVLAQGGVRATIHPELGGRIGQLDLGDGPLLRGRRPGLPWTDWGCYPLLPWSNRIPHGRLRFGTIDTQLPVTGPDGSALHGLAAAAAWTVVASSEQRVELTVRVEAGPYRMIGEQTIELAADELRLHLRATNDGERPVPVGIGIHPWFRSGRVTVPAEEVWPGEPIPTGPPRPVTGRHDLRRVAVPEPMDACFTALTASTAHVPGARLSWEGPITQVVVYSGAEGWVAVEPVTMATDGFALAERGLTGHGVQTLDPGASIEARYRIEGSR